MSEAAQVETNLSTEAAPAVEIPPAIKPALRAVVVCGAAAAIPAGYDLALVAEGRTYQAAIVDAEGETVQPASSCAVTSGYPAGAALYLRTDPEVCFPDNSPVLTLGVDVLQWKFGGFCPHPGAVSVGPCHPAYAAANLAWQRGATAIDVIGLDADEKERLAPWFDGLPTHAVEPAQVAVSIL